MDQKQLQEQRLRLEKAIKDHGNIAAANHNAEWEAKWQRLNAAYDANQKKLDEQQRQQAVKDRLAKIDSAKTNLGRDGAKLATGPVNRKQFSPADLNQSRTGDDLVNALAGWLMTGSVHANLVTDDHRQSAQRLGVNFASPVFRFSLNNDWATVKNGAYRYRTFRNALSGQDGSSGGYTKSETLINNLELAMLAYGGMMEVAEIIRTSTGEPMRWPTADDTGNTGRQVGENASHDSGTDPTFGNVIWNAYTFTSDIIKVPNELMTDAGSGGGLSGAFNLASILGDMLGQRLGRIQNTKYTTGTGAGTAKGITLCATAGVSAASATAIAFDELIDLEHSLDPSRRKMPGVGYMFHDSILKALRKLKDGEGRYLWQAGANEGAPDTLNTYPYTVNQDMASSIASTNITVLFGQLSAYKIRQVGEIVLRRLDERYADTNQTGFLAFVRGDGNLLDAGDGPVMKLTN